MSVDIGSVVSNGIERVFSKSGAYALGVNTVVQFLLVTVLFGEVVMFNWVEGQPGLQLVVGIVIVGTFVLGWAGTALAYVGSARWLVRSADALQTTPWSALTRRAGTAAVSVMALNLGLGIAVFFGSLFFLLPGILIATVAIFSLIVVAVEDAGPLSAVTRSWALTEGHRVELFVVGFVFQTFFSVTGQFFGLFVIIPLIGWLVFAAFLSVQTVLSIAILTEAYRQITDEAAAA